MHRGETQAGAGERTKRARNQDSNPRKDSQSNADGCARAGADGAGAAVRDMARLRLAESAIVRAFTGAAGLASVRCLAGRMPWNKPSWHIGALTQAVELALLDTHGVPEAAGWPGVVLSAALAHLRHRGATAAGASR